MRYGESSRQSDRKEEIKEFNKALEEFGLSFDELVKVSPKKKDARNRAKDIAKVIAQDYELTRYLIDNKLLPLKQLEKMCSISRKTMERQRKYIIAIVLVLTGDYTYLKEYITGKE